MGPLTGGGVLILHSKKALCHPVKFKKCSCCPVEFKKCPCPMSLYVYISCRMSLRPKMSHVALPILGSRAISVCVYESRFFKLAFCCYGDYGNAYILLILTISVLKTFHFNPFHPIRPDLASIQRLPTMMSIFTGYLLSVSLTIMLVASNFS